MLLFHEAMRAAKRLSIRRFSQKTRQEDKEGRECRVLNNVDLIVDTWIVETFTGDDP